MNNNNNKNKNTIYNNNNNNKQKEYGRIQKWLQRMNYYNENDEKQLTNIHYYILELIDLQTKLHEVNTICIFCK